MAHFQAVRSGLAISQSIADMLERADPAQYNGANRTQTIREVNDILQGRSELSFDMLYSILEQKCGGEAGQVEKVKRDAEAFRHQKLCRTLRYTLSGSQEYHYETWDFDPKRPLKIISQPLFDHAAEHGFPPDFFTASYFDHVTIYCMPDNVDCSFSQFQNCRFSVCGIRGAVFDNATLDNTDFHSTLLQMVNFTGASIAHAHFRDSSLVSVSFQEARLKSCLTLDCTLDRVDFLGAVLDGSSYDRVAASGIQNLPSATITQGGATHEEAERLRASVFHELGVPMFQVRQRPRPTRQERPRVPER
ncbi:pentapeptide repeat-containing protein [Oscillospiraceae bacterium 44-34]